MFRGQKKDSAIDFIKVRRRLRALSGLELDEIPISNSDKDKWVGLYLDERGVAGRPSHICPQFIIGGIYVVGPADEDKWNKFEKNLIPGYIKHLRDFQRKIEKARKAKNQDKIRRLRLFQEKNKAKHRPEHIIHLDDFKKGKVNIGGLNIDDFFIRAIKLTTYRKEPDDVKAVSIHKNMLKKLVGKLFLGVILPLLKEKASIQIKKVFIRYGTCVRPAKNGTTMIKMGYNQVPGTPKHFILNPSELDPPSLEKKYIKSVFADCEIGECRGVMGDDFEAFQVIADAILDEYKDTRIKGIQAELDQYPGMYERYKGEENDSLSHFVNANECFYKNYEGIYDRYFDALYNIAKDEAWEFVEGVIETYNNQSPNTARAYICKRLGREAYQEILKDPENFYKLRHPPKTSI